MKKNKALKSAISLALITFIASVGAEAQSIRPEGAQAGQVRWQELGAFSDGFEGVGLDANKWENAPASLVVGAWTFDKANAYVSEGKLNIKATQETHTRVFNDVCQGGAATLRELYYKSGAVRTKLDSVYGFYEAKIKGVKVFPGLSPAFWLYSDGHPFPDRHVPGSVDYSEIDIVELQQADWFGPGPNDADPINHMDHNLHARVVDQAGNIQWRRPKPFPEAQLLKYDAPFDPSEEFHVYAVENRKDMIFWYVDGKLIGQKPNLFWHRPMHMIFSMGLRRQFIQYNATCQRADPNPSNVTTEGFPERATMQVEYVKSWAAQPSVWVDNVAKYTSTPYSADGDIEVTVGYHGGSNSHLVKDVHGGIKVNLVEKNASGVVGVVATGINSTAADEGNQYGGEVKVNIDLSGVKASADLPAGHFYVLAPVFRASTGADVYAQGVIGNITIIKTQAPNPPAVTGLTVAPVEVALTVGQTRQLTATVYPFDAANKAVTWHSANAAVASVDQAGLVTAKQAGGPVVINAQSSDGPFNAVSNIVVSAAEASCDKGWVSVMDVSLTPAQFALKKGESKVLSYAVAPTCASNQGVVFSSNNTRVATVSNLGKVTARGVGTATITVKTKNKGKTATAEVSVS